MMMRHEGRTARRDGEGGGWERADETTRAQHYEENEMTSQRDKCARFTTICSLSFTQQRPVELMTHHQPSDVTFWGS